MTTATGSRRSRRAESVAAPVNGRGNLTPEVWIDSALAMLVDGGIDLVRVDVIAKKLQVTRGSFYWHFRDRDDLLSRVLDTWRNAATEQIIERFDRKRGEPKELIKELLSLPFRGQAAHRAARVELAIRDWARRDPMARHAVDDVDSRRISYIAQCFSALGFDLLEARSRAFLLYACEVAESLLFNQGTSSQKTERSRLAERLLLTKL
jgi:AcrR family transcriptional regulator